MVAGRLANFVDNWRALTSDKFILNCIKGYKLRFVECPSQESIPFAPILKESQNMSDMESTIEKLCAQGAIRTCTPCSGQFLSSYFLVSKKDGTFRFVLNLKKLNEFIPTSHFKMEDGRTASKLLSQGDYMGKVDLKDAYFLVSVHESSRKYLRFMFRDTLYEFTCLPFGLNIAPWLFTKIIKPVVNSLRKKGFYLVVYLDDFLCIGSTFAKCQENVDVTIELLQNLGFVINFSKSALTPMMKMEFLGLVFNSKEMVIELPVAKEQKMLHLLRRYSRANWCTIQEWASFVGFVNSCCPAVCYGRLYTKLFEREKFLSLQRNDGRYNARFEIPQSLQSDFDWWESHVSGASNPIFQNNFVREIFSDASLIAWGAACENHKARGFWKVEERKLHINQLELMAAFMALKCFAADLEECEILLRVDNTTAIAYINKMGGIRFPQLNTLARKIWAWCEQRKIRVFASYIKSADNVVADAESRFSNIDTEWEISNEAFRAATRLFGKPLVDLFASRCNAKCARFFSWGKDPEAAAIDAFTMNWAKEGFFWAFPPFSMVLKTLQKIKMEGVKGIVVVPKWENQPWYPLFRDLTISRTLEFQPSCNLLLSPCRAKQHPLANSLPLIAAVLSGKR